MDWIESLVLGAVQGLTEFLPISSDGHLTITQLGFEHFTGKKTAAADKIFFDVMLHVGTLMAILLSYRNQIAAGAKGLLDSASEVSATVSAAVRDPDGSARRDRDPAFDPGQAVLHGTDRKDFRQLDLCRNRLSDHCRDPPPHSPSQRGRERPCGDDLARCLAHRTCADVRPPAGGQSERPDHLGGTRSRILPNLGRELQPDDGRAQPSWARPSSSCARSIRPPSPPNGLLRSSRPRRWPE